MLLLSGCAHETNYAENRLVFRRTGIPLIEVLPISPEMKRKFCKNDGGIQE